MKIRSALIRVRWIDAAACQVAGSVAQEKNSQPGSSCGIAAYHDVIVGTGTLPLPSLEQLLPYINQTFAERA